jgi:hypothetical protein
MRATRIVNISRFLLLLQAYDNVDTPYFLTGLRFVFAPAKAQKVSGHIYFVPAVGCVWLAGWKN